MKFLSLFNPKQKDIKEIKEKLQAAQPVLTWLKDMYISKRIAEIDKILESQEIYDKPGYDRYISGCLSLRSELKKIADLLTLEENK